MGKTLDDFVEGKIKHGGVTYTVQEMRLGQTIVWPIAYTYVISNVVSSYGGSTYGNQLKATGANAFTVTCTVKTYQGSTLISTENNVPMYLTLNDSEYSQYFTVTDGKSVKFNREDCGTTDMSSIGTTLTTSWSASLHGSTHNFNVELQCNRPMNTSRSAVLTGASVSPASLPASGGTVACASGIYVTTITDFLSGDISTEYSTTGTIRVYLDGTLETSFSAGGSTNITVPANQGSSQISHTISLRWSDNEIYRENFTVTQEAVVDAYVFARYTPTPVDVVATSTMAAIRVTSLKNGERLSLNASCVSTSGTIVERSITFGTLDDDIIIIFQYPRNTGTAKYMDIVLTQPESGKTLTYRINQAAAATTYVLERVSPATVHICGRAEFGYIVVRSTKNGVYQPLDDGCWSKVSGSTNFSGISYEQFGEDCCLIQFYYDRNTGAAINNVIELTQPDSLNTVTFNVVQAVASLYTFELNWDSDPYDDGDLIVSSQDVELYDNGDNRGDYGFIIADPGQFEVDIPSSWIYIMNIDSQADSQLLLYEESSGLMKRLYIQGE